MDSLKGQEWKSTFSETDYTLWEKLWTKVSLLPKCIVLPKSSTRWKWIWNSQWRALSLDRTNCSGKQSVQDSDCLRELWRTIVARIVFKCVSYLRTLVLSMYFYKFTVKICLNVCFYMKYLLIPSGKVRDICFDFLHWKNRPVIKVQLLITNCYSL